ncbi:isoprenyl transferase [Desulfatirhabdium butyrativorans]|uniref:isoprenyl transferase n=1 Tax=Desulfatirhabdium butyrativorans TaxID=340467 RepID=UPI00040C27EE|nr:isoprenyl transferase [Desulfatirhabdium butyrativorans]
MSSDALTTQSGLDPAKVPRHVAIIMDGNGRWAKQRLMNRVRGHEKGAETVRTIVTASREIGIAFLTLYAFSTENWQRSAAEVAALMRLLKNFLVTERDLMMRHDIRLSTIGEVERLPEDVRATLSETLSLTAGNRSMVLTLALSYGARAEIVRMVRTVATDVLEGRISAESIDEKRVSQGLYTRDMPDPDLLIRTSGEMRISNFLLWQIAYSELAITKTLWPDFSREEYLAILQDYQHRERRFGIA